MKNIDFYKLDVEIDGKEILLLKGFIPLHNKNENIVVAGLFVETDRIHAFDIHFPKKEMFRGSGLYPLLAVGLDTSHDDGDHKSRVSFIYDTDLKLLLNNGIASSYSVRQFFVGKKSIGPDSPDYITIKSLHEIGHATVGYLESGDEILGGTVSIRGHSSITGTHDMSTIEGLEIKIREALGGLAAEKIIGDVHNNSLSDLTYAAHVIVVIILNFATISVKHGTVVFDLPDGRPSVTVGTAVRSLIMYYLTQTQELLAGKEYLIRELADHLIDEGELSAERFEEIIGRYRNEVKI